MIRHSDQQRQEFLSPCLELGNSSVGCVLLNRTQSDFVQTTNWLYYSDDNWSSDPKLTISTSLPYVSPMIKISLDGAAARVKPRAGGEYRPNGEWSCRHPVFSNGNMYLCVWCGSWGVSSNPDKNKAACVLQSQSKTTTNICSSFFFSELQHSLYIPWLTKVLFSCLCLNLSLTSRAFRVCCIRGLHLETDPY